MDNCNICNSGNLLLDEGCCVPCHIEKYCNDTCFVCKTTKQIQIKKIDNIFIKYATIVFILNYASYVIQEI